MRQPNMYDPSNPRASGSERDEYSESNSPMATASPHDRQMSMSPAAQLGAVAPLHRQGSDMGYGIPIPGHLRSELQHSPRSSPSLTSQPMYGAVQQQAGRVTSHPTGYANGPPQVLEPAPQSHSGQPTSASGSPHMSAMGWQSPGHPGMGSPNPGEHYAYPDPAAQYGGHQQNMYYQSVPRPTSTEPGSYSRAQDQLWAPQTVQ
jgi:hypothetical protein